MIRFENNLEYNLYRQKLLGGNVVGIWENNSFFVGSNSFPVMKYHYITAKFNNFEKNIFSSNFNVNYHLSGYGIKYNEALVSFLGESSERYAFTLLYKNVEKLIVTSSFSELKDSFKEDYVLPLSLINVYFKESETDHFLEEQDIIQWIPLTSLYDVTKKVFIPLQLFVLFDKNIFKEEKQLLNSAVSTGTASHETFEGSLKNSLIEILQIDSYNLWWYGGIKGKSIEVNIEKKLKEWFNDDSFVDFFLENFTVNFIDISFDKPIEIIVCEIKSKTENSKLPKYVIGVQGGFDRENSIYRGFLEALTILEYVFTVVWIDTDTFKKIPEDILSFSIDNLDDNVIYYAKYGKSIQLKEQVIEFKEESKVKNLFDLIKSLKSISEYACFLDITPVEFHNKNLCVSRVIVPELLPIALPSYPPFYHPRYKEVGGILNNVPHPMA